MNRYFKIVIATALISVTTSANAIDRKTLAQYASSLTGLKKEQLKTALHKLMGKKDVLPYGGGGHGTWWGFWYSDRNPQTNECYNRYSDKKFYFESTNTGKSIAGMNIEHSFPKSWWGKTKNDAWCDLYNLYPSDEKANSSKSNYPMGVVVNVKEQAGEGYDKVGDGYADGQLTRMWEPGDAFKGEFSRSYMYMATTYQDLKWEKDGLQSLENKEWPTLKQWAYKLYLQWNKKDRVDQIEIKRNEAIYRIQHNRNLFIDYPELAEYVWGDSMDVAFDPYNAITTASDDNRYTGVIVPEEPVTPDNPQVTPQGTIFVKTTIAPVADKRYVLVINTGSSFLAASTVKNKKYGYLPTKNITDDNGKVRDADNQSVLTLEQGITGFYIKDANGKYFGQKDEYKTVQFMTKDKAVEWTFEPNADGTFTITSSTGHVLQYDTDYKTLGAYKPASAAGIYPMLYVEDPTASVETIWNITITDDAVYNLQGVRMPADTQLAPGIYLRNGKKFIVR